jgi:NADH dehydrogenase
MYKNILLIGGSGFIGTALAARLAKQGRRIIVPTRRIKHADTLLMIPQVDVIQADVNDDKTLQQLIAGADAVINLVGILQGGNGNPYGARFARAHVELPQRIVRYMKLKNVKRLLHVSALGVTGSQNSPSMYLRSKTDGERAVRGSFLNWTIYRPSVVFGPDDKFLNMFAKLASMAPILPLAGADVKFQPIYVEDLAQGIINTLDNPEAEEKTYEMTGPKVYTLRELVSLSATLSGNPRPIIGLPGPLAWLQALAMEMAPGEPLMSRDNLGSMKVDNVATTAMSPDLGYIPTALEPIAARYLSPAHALTVLDHYRGKAHR